jgi:hypothetical protein
MMKQSIPIESCVDQSRLRTCYGNFDIKQVKHVGDLITELWAFMKERKKYWMLPIIIVLMLFGSLLIFAQGSAVAPFIYTLF